MPEYANLAKRTVSKTVDFASSTLAPGTNFKEERLTKIVRENEPILVDSISLLMAILFCLHIKKDSNE